MQTEYDSPYVMKRIYLSSLGSVILGYQAGVFNPIQSYLESYILPGISKANIAFLTSALTIGAAIGSFTAGKLMNKIGRNKSILVADILGILSCLITVIPHFDIMLIGRFIGGIAVGLNSSIVPLYNDEVTPIELRPTTEIFVQFFACVGLLIAFIIGIGTPSTPGSEWWRLMILIPIIMCFTKSYFIQKEYPTETPAYLYQNQMIEEATKALRRMYFTESRVQHELNILRGKYAEIKEELTYTGLVQPQYLNVMILGCGISALQQLVGINAISFYSTQIFSQGITDPSDKTPLICTIIVGVLNCVSAFITKPILQKMTKRSALFLGNAGIFISITAIIYLDKQGGSSFLKYWVFLYTLVFGFSMGSITWILVGQILPDLGVGVAVLTNWSCAFLVVQLFPILVESYGIGTSLYPFAFFSLFAIWFLNKYVQDDSNREHVQLNEEGVELEAVSSGIKQKLLK